MHQQCPHKVITMHVIRVVFEGLAECCNGFVKTILEIRKGGSKIVEEVERNITREVREEEEEEETISYITNIPL